MNNRNMIFKLVARARLFKEHISKQILRSMQEQRKYLKTKASKPVVFNLGVATPWVSFASFLRVARASDKKYS